VSCYKQQEAVGASAVHRCSCSEVSP